MLDTLITLITIPTSVFFNVVSYVFESVLSIIASIGTLLGLWLLLKFLAFRYTCEENRAKATFSRSRNFFSEHNAFTFKSRK
ncbi:hypothetical protein C9J21_18400 [Photobacterium phosphoreum]|uniref:hypothetical protein n=1 Tax=Photobacterium phosphoreum TaxID=659 RepID=UPI000D151F40|nr:hypothetical protein [Photobacterium phosphoreum]PSW30776.1 hypothetical protein C9J21_18400 [Photobacterium phosphoreum]